MTCKHTNALKDLFKNIAKLYTIAILQILLTQVLRMDQNIYGPISKVEGKITLELDHSSVTA